MENVIALAVQDMHSSCSETSLRAASRVRSVTPVVTPALPQGTALSTIGFASDFSGVAPAFNGTPQTYGTRKDLISTGYLSWNPPV
jgi:hypothetical protein